MTKKIVCLSFSICIVKLRLCDKENAAREQIQSLQTQLSDIHGQQSEALKACQSKANTRCNELEQQLLLSNDREAELVERLNEFTIRENLLRDNVQACEQEFAERLQAAAARERELNDKVVQIMRKLKAESDRCGELEDRVKLADVLQQRRINNDDENQLVNGGDGSSTTSKSQMMEDEVDSLRSVLDLKLNEISDLRKQNHKLQAAHDELPHATTKISMLESRLEDLSIQYQAKVGEEM